MTANEAKQKYIDRFGGFPEFLFMSASDDSIIKAVEKALKDNEEIEPEYDDGVY